MCVVTKRAICSECSTRHRGVNYSKEGLAVVLERERAAAAEGSGAGGAVFWFAVAALPVSVGFFFLCAFVSGGVLIDLVQSLRMDPS